MGNSVARELTPEQKDLKFLGDRFPFGDVELQHLYQAYQNWRMKPACSSHSFLCDWSMQCSVNPANDRSASRMMSVEEKILPTQWGNALYQTCFCAPGDLRLYSSSLSEDNDEHTLDGNKDTSTHVVDEYTRKARLETFFEGLAGCSRRGATAALTVLFEAQTVLDAAAPLATKAEQNADSHKRRISARSFVETGYRIALASAYLQSKKDIQEYLPAATEEGDDLQAFAQSIIEKGRRRRQRSGLPGCATTECPFLQQGLVELTDILEWSDAVAPMFASILPTFFHFVLFPATPFPRSRTAFECPVVDSSSTFFTSQHKQKFMNARLFTVACLSSSLTGWYYRLYTSAADGLSFNRLQNAVLGYGGPTLILVRSTSGSVFGAFTATAWKESRDFYGNTDCFLYQLSPCTAVYRPTGGSERNFMYCNSAARSRGYDQQAHGIGFGGTVQEPRLFLAENFDECVASSQDLTFDNGKLVAESGSTGQFEIDSLEVWGVGGTETVESGLEAREMSRSVTEEAIRRARKVDKAQFLDDFRAGIIGSKAFQHIQEVDGRANADLDDRCQDKEKVYE